MAREDGPASGQLGSRGLSEKDPPVARAERRTKLLRDGKMTAEAVHGSCARWGRRPPVPTTVSAPCESPGRVSCHFRHDPRGQSRQRLDFRERSLTGIGSPANVECWMGDGMPLLPGNDATRSGRGPRHPQDAARRVAARLRDLPDKAGQRDKGPAPALIAPAAPRVGRANPGAPPTYRASKEGVPGHGGRDTGLQGKRHFLLPGSGGRDTGLRGKDFAFCVGSVSYG